MRYFQDRSDEIIEIEEEEHLEHGRFGSFRKNHKYIGRVWKGGRWVYQYAKNKAGKVAKAAGYAYGSEYKKDMEKLDKKIDAGLQNMWESANTNYKAKTTGDDELKKRNSEYFDKVAAQTRSDMDKKNYATAKYFASPAYAVSQKKKEVSNTVKKVKDALTPKTTITQTSNLYPERTKKVLKDDTGSKPKGTYFTVGADGTTVQYTPETKKKKKLFHDDLHETVDLGESIMDEFFGR